MEEMAEEYKHGTKESSSDELGYVDWGPCDTADRVNQQRSQEEQKEKTEWMN